MNRACSVCSWVCQAVVSALSGSRRGRHWRWRGAGECRLGQLCCTTLWLTGWLTVASGLGGSTPTVWLHLNMKPKRVKQTAGGAEVSTVQVCLSDSHVSPNINTQSHTYARCMNAYTIAGPPHTKTHVRNEQVYILAINYSSSVWKLHQICITCKNKKWLSGMCFTNKQTKFLLAYWTEHFGFKIVKYWFPFSLLRKHA